MRPLQFKKLFHVKRATGLIFTGNFYVCPQNIRCYSTGTVLLSGDRRYGAKFGEIVTGVAGAGAGAGAGANGVGNQSAKSIENGVAQRNGRLSEAPVQNGNRKSESGSGSRGGNIGQIN